MNNQVPNEDEYRDYFLEEAATVKKEIQAPKGKRKGPRGGVVVPFPVKLYNMLLGVEKEGLENIVAWQPHGRCFMVYDSQTFVEDVMPRYFRQSKLTSFQRQLNLYGFLRLSTGRDRGAYYHELFLRGRPDLCHVMFRTRVKGLRGGEQGGEPNFYLMPPCSEALAELKFGKMPSPSKENDSSVKNIEAPAPIPSENETDNRNAIADPPKNDEFDEAINKAIQQEIDYSDTIPAPNSVSSSKTPAAGEFMMMPQQVVTPQVPRSVYQQPSYGTSQEATGPMPPPPPLVTSSSTWPATNILGSIATGAMANNSSSNNFRNETANEGQLDLEPTPFAPGHHRSTTVDVRAQLPSSSNEIKFASSEHRKQSTSDDFDFGDEDSGFFAGLKFNFMDPNSLDDFESTFLNSIPS